MFENNEKTQWKPMRKNYFKWMTRQKNPKEKDLHTTTYTTMVSLCKTLDFHKGSADEESACNTGDTGDMGRRFIHCLGFF